MAEAVKEWVRGVVASANDKGVKLEDESDYANWSRYATGEHVTPSKGTKVRLGLDKDGWIRAITDADGNPLGGGAGAAVVNNVVGRQTMTREDLRRITMLSCLRSACTLLAGLGMPEVQEGKPKPAPSNLALATALRWAEEIAPELFKQEMDGQGK